MRNFISFSICLIVFFIIQLFGSCSQPLDSISDNGQFAIDTLYIIDTTEFADTNIFVDTVSIIDTITIIDTLSFVDTLSFADTVLLVEAMYCDRLNWFHRQIDWTMDNNAGLYSFEFIASTEQAYSLPSLIIEINDQQYYWNLEDGFELNIEQNVDPETVVSISYASLQSCDRTIEVCFRVKAA